MPVSLTAQEAEGFESGRLAPAYLDLLGAAGFRACAAASRLGVFAALADGPATAAEVAERAGIDATMTGLLLRMLTAYGYLEVDGDRVALTEASRVHLVPGPRSYTAVLEFWDRLLGDLWPSLEQSVRSGRPAEDFYGWLEDHPTERETFQAMLAGLAGRLSGELRERVPLPPGGLVLDVAGGHGRYAVEYLTADPEARALIVDLPGALDIARTTCEGAGVGGRCTYAAWDLRSGDPLPAAGADVALLYNVVHGFTAETNMRLLHQVAEALAPGGLVGVLEQLGAAVTERTPCNEAFVQMFSLNLAHGQSGRSYTLDDITGWLAEAGFADVADSALDASATDHLITAHRPG